MTATVVGISLITLVIMAIQHSIWRVSAESPQALPTARLDSEQLLEDMITKDPRILSGEWMLIGRQEVTSFGGRIDLLAIAPDASLGPSTGAAFTPLSF